MSTPIFPLAVWQSGTNENSIPANDNALRVQVALGAATGFANAAPSTPAEDQQVVVGTAWGGFATGHVVIRKGGTWIGFIPFEGWLKAIAGNVWRYTSGAWEQVTTGGGVAAEDVDYDNTASGLSAENVQDAIDELATGSPGGSSFAPVATISTSTHSLVAADAGKYNRVTYGGAAAVTVQTQASAAMPTDAEIHLRAVGGALTVTAASGVTVNPPAGGTSVIPIGGTATLKWVGGNEWDLFGVTVPA